MPSKRPNEIVDLAKWIKRKHSDESTAGSEYSAATSRSAASSYASSRVKKHKKDDNNYPTSKTKDKKGQSKGKKKTAADDAKSSQSAKSGTSSRRTDKSSRVTFSASSSSSSDSSLASDELANFKTGKVKFAVSQVKHQQTMAGRYRSKSSVCKALITMPAHGQSVADLSEVYRRRENRKRCRAILTSLLILLLVLAGISGLVYLVIYLVNEEETCGTDLQCMCDGHNGFYYTNKISTGELDWNDVEDTPILKDTTHEQKVDRNFQVKGLTGVDRLEYFQKHPDQKIKRPLDVLFLPSKPTTGNVEVNVEFLTLQHLANWGYRAVTVNGMKDSDFLSAVISHLDLTNVVIVIQSSDAWQDVLDFLFSKHKTYPTASSVVGLVTMSVKFDQVGNNYIKKFSHRKIPSLIVYGARETNMKSNQLTKSGRHFVAEIPDAALDWSKQKSQRLKFYPALRYWLRLLLLSRECL